MNAFASITTGAGVVLLGIGALVLLRSGTPPATEPTGGAGIESHGSGVTGSGSDLAPERGFLGVVVAGEAVDVAARAEGRVLDVQVRLGDQVARDGVLATLDDRPLRDELAVAQASLRAARAEEKKAALELDEARERHTRWEEALGTGAGAVSADELARVRYEAKYAAARLEAAQARVAEHQARVTDLDRQIRDAVIRAPFDGLVAMRYVDAGATVQRGSAIVRLVGASSLRVRFAVPEAQGAAVAVGLPVAVRLDELGIRLDGVIEKVAPEIDAASRMILAEARVEVPDSLAQATLSGRVARVQVTADGRAARTEP